MGRAQVSTAKENFKFFIADYRKQRAAAQGATAK